MSNECREEVAVVHIEPLTQTLLAYLRKHVRLLSSPQLSFVPLCLVPLFPASLPGAIDARYTLLSCRALSFAYSYS